MTFPHILNQKLASPDNLLMYTTHILAWHSCYILHAGIRSNALDSNTDIARDCKAKQIVKPKRKNQVGKHNRAVYTVCFQLKMSWFYIKCMSVISVKLLKSQDAFNEL